MLFQFLIWSLWSLGLAAFCGWAGWRMAKLHQLLHTEPRRMPEPAAEPAAVTYGTPVRTGPADLETTRVRFAAIADRALVEAGRR